MMGFQQARRLHRLLAMQKEPQQQPKRQQQKERGRKVQQEKGKEEGNQIRVCALVMACLLISYRR